MHHRQLTVIAAQGEVAETLRQTLAGLLTDAEMSAAGFLLDQGPASSFKASSIDGGAGSSSSLAETTSAQAHVSQPSMADQRSEHDAALRAELSKIGGSRSAYQADSGQQQAQLDSAPHAALSTSAPELPEPPDEGAKSSLSSDTLEFADDDDWLDRDQLKEEDLRFEAEAIADMIREANLTALAQQLQTMYDEYDLADEYE